MPTLRSGNGAADGVCRTSSRGGMIPFAEFLRTGRARRGAGMAAFYERLAPQSARTLAEPFTVDLPAGLDKTYVFASRRAVDPVSVVRRGGPA